MPCTLDNGHNFKASCGSILTSDILPTGQLGYNSEGSGIFNHPRVLGSVLFSVLSSRLISKFPLSLPALYESHMSPVPGEVAGLHSVAFA